MRMLELFSGTGVMGDAFAKHGFDVVKVDKNPKFDATHEDAYKYLSAHGDEFGVIWAAPDCCTYSRATHLHRIEHGSSEPKTEYARYCDKMNEWLFSELERLADNGAVIFVENPVGHMRKMPWSQNIPRYTTTLCRYGFDFRKPTDIWTNIELDDLMPPCKRGSLCHKGKNNGGPVKGVAYVHGADRAAYPPFLAEYIVRKVLADGRATPWTT